MKQCSRPFSAHLTLPLILLFLFSVCCFSSAPVVYALPDVPITGWVEVRCDPIPQDFSETATVVLSNTESGEYYTITCHKINDYIGRLELPAGKYRIEQTSTADNFAYEASTTLNSFEITADMSAAQLIPMSIVKHDASYELPSTDADEPVTAPAPADSATPSIDADSESEDAAPSVPETKEVSNSILDWLKQETAPDEPDTSEAIENVQTDETPASFSGSRVVMITLGTILFIIIIMIISYFARQHFERD